MKRFLLICLILASIGLFGCESKWGTAGLGAAGGAAASVGGYEYHAKREMERIENEFKDGKIDQREYEIRKDQVQRDSLFYK